MKKIAFINGRCWNPAAEKWEILNFVLANGKVMGIGYLPDETDDVEIIDISNRHVVFAATSKGIFLMGMPSFTVVNPSDGTVLYRVDQGRIIS